jgi:hypothetical protein
MQKKNNNVKIIINWEGIPGKKNKNIAKLKKKGKIVIISIMKI